MTVEVIQMQGSRGGGGAASFSDNFNRANNISLGPQWYSLIHEDESAATVQFGINANTMRIRNGAGAGFLNGAYAVPVSLDRLLFTGDSQFAQATIIGDSSIVGSVTRCGLAVALNGSPYNVRGTTNYMNGYNLMLIPEALTFNLVRIFQPINLTTGTPFAIGDVLRLSMTFNVADNFIQASVNGVPVVNFTDIDVTRPITGVPGFRVDGIDAARFSDYDNFSCGKGV